MECLCQDIGVCMSSSVVKNMKVLDYYNHFYSMSSCIVIQTKLAKTVQMSHFYI